MTRATISATLFFHFHWIPWTNRDTNLTFNFEDDFSMALRLMHPFSKKPKNYALLGKKKKIRETIIS
jgi:hypothetical protein